MKCIPPHTPILYSKTGVYRGVPIFLIFAPKHRLWVLVRTASPRTASARRFCRGGSNMYPQSMFLSQNNKNIKIFQLKKKINF